MNIKKYIISVILLLLSANLFAKDKSVVFFFESLDGISPKVVQRISSSDNFHFSAMINNYDNILPEIENLIVCNKIEPTLTLNPEPYFPLISSEIFINKAISFDRQPDLKILLSTYKNTLKTLFGKRKYGIFLNGGILNENTLNIFYKSNILWTTAKLNNDLQKGVYIKNKVAVFVPYMDFPKDEKQVLQWLSDKNEKIIPIFLTRTHIKNEKLMLYLIDLFDKSKYTDTNLPINVAYDITKDNVDNITLKNLGAIPKELLLKLAKASDEVNSTGDSEIYSTLFDELTNMYSYNIINGIFNEDEKAGTLFNISYANIFKLSSKEVPTIEELNKEEKETNGVGTTEVTNICEFIKMNNTLAINNDGIIKIFTITKTDSSIDFVIDADLSQVEYFDIYIDMNGIAYTGCQNMLKNINGFFVPENCWEYAIRIAENTINIYRFSVDSENLIKTIDKNSKIISIDSNILRGNPDNWSYQVVAVKNGSVVDFLEDSQKKIKILETNPLQLKMFKYIQ